MVRNDSPYQNFRQLAGTRVAVPSRFAVDYPVPAPHARQENMRIEELEIVEMPPPDMPAALYANAVDAYCTGEPFGAAAQSAGYREAAAHDARRVAEVHLLRAHRARRADRGNPPWCRTWSTSARRRRVARSAAANREKAVQIAGRQRSSTRIRRSSAS
jgi:hypothetical protein